MGILEGGGGALALLGMEVPPLISMVYIEVNLHLLVLDIRVFPNEILVLPGPRAQENEAHMHIEGLITFLHPHQRN